MVKLQFNGRNYSGWQKQENASTVQGAVETALKNLFGEEILSFGCSRTDAGVSAEEYYFHFDAETKLPEERVAFKLNRFLPNDVQAQESREVPFSFDARRSVKSKTYVYSLYASPHKMPLYSPTHFQTEAPFFAEKVREQAEFLVGTHDFSSFRTVGYEDSSENKSTVRTIYSIDIKQEENRYYIYVSGDGFLYHMVRILSGTLVDVGAGKTDDVERILNAKDRSLAGRTLPAKGLKLYKVNY